MSKLTSRVESWALAAAASNGRMFLTIFGFLLFRVYKIRSSPVDFRSINNQDFNVQSEFKGSFLNDALTSCPDISLLLPQGQRQQQYVCLFLSLSLLFQLKKNDRTMKKVSLSVE